MEISAVLRVRHAGLDLDACLPWLPPSRLDHVWRVGEKGLLNRVHETSGFNLHLAEGPAGGSVVQDAVAAFRELAEPVAALVRGGAHAEVDFGLFLDVNGVTPLSVWLEPAAAAAFERAGVTITVTAYPCSDDDKGEDEDDHKGD